VMAMRLRNWCAKPCSPAGSGGNGRNH